MGNDRKGVRRGEDKERVRERFRGRIGGKMDGEIFEDIKGVIDKPNDKMKWWDKRKEESNMIKKKVTRL